MSALLPSTVLAEVRDMLRLHSHSGRSLDAELCEVSAAALDDVEQETLALEALGRAKQLLPRGEYFAAVRGLPPATRRAIARSALRSASTRVSGRSIPCSPHDGDAA
jgi:hypothetical protein